jgi:hypothetical protein
MGIFTKIIDFLSGGFGGKIVDAVLKQLPEEMTEEQKAKISMAINQASHEQGLKLLKLAQQEEKMFNDRIALLEGTSSDLKSSGILGKAVLFLRGLQRPVWGYSVLIFDIMIFSGRWRFPDTNTIGLDYASVFWVMNFLVLGFLFGERALMNVIPLIKSLKSIQGKE